MADLVPSLRVLAEHVADHLDSHLVRVHTMAQSMAQSRTTALSGAEAHVAPAAPVRRRASGGVQADETPARIADRATVRP